MSKEKQSDKPAAKDVKEPTPHELLAAVHNDPNRSWEVPAAPVEPPPEKPPPGTEPPLGGSTRAAKGPEASDDPDEIEDELEQMKEEGDVEVRGKSPAPKKK